MLLEKLAQPEKPQLKQGYPLYRAVWRWHFYAGLFVIPFLLVLSLSGLVMLITKPIEPLLQQSLLSVEATGNTLPASAQLSIIRERYPDAKVQLYIPPRHATESTRFSLLAHHAAGHSGHNAPTTTVYLNPYNGTILGELDPGKTLYAQVKKFHGTLFLGDAGDSLIEIAAGLSALMIISGLYLAWPRVGWRTLVSRNPQLDREKWRQLHRKIGLMIALPLLFFLLSGLAWTNVWGGKLVQAWSSLPGTSFEAPKTEQTHQSMNHEGLHQVPWALEQTPLPLSAAGPEKVDLDTVSNIANEQGFTHYRVHLPQHESVVWTLSATTIAGDLTNPLQERTLHIDRSNGRVLADLKFSDYSAMGMAMAAFIPLHQGDLGLWNWLLNLLLVTLVVVMIASGITMWWKRRPGNDRKLNPPAAPAVYSKAVIAGMLVISLCFPLSAAALLLIALFDRVIISRLQQFQVSVK